MTSYAVTVTADNDSWTGGLLIEAVSATHALTAAETHMNRLAARLGVTVRFHATDARAMITPERQTGSPRRPEADELQRRRWWRG